MPFRVTKLYHNNNKKKILQKMSKIGQSVRALERFGQRSSLKLYGCM